MMKTATRILAATAGLGIVAAPIVAQANTRAGDSGAVYSTSNALPGLGRSAGGEGQAEGGVDAGTLILGVVATGVIIAGVVTAAQSDDDRASPGT